MFCFFIVNKINKSFTFKIASVISEKIAIFLNFVGTHNLKNSILCKTNKHLARFLPKTDFKSIFWENRSISPYLNENFQLG